MTVRRAATVMVLLALTTACGQAPRTQSTTTNGGADNAWTVVGESPIRDLAMMGRLTDTRLVEASGAVHSALHPGIFWSQNDSGNSAMLFAYDSSGASRGAIVVEGAKNTDWEALAIGPCPLGQCIYIGDVGDNFRVRGEVSLLRMSEPRTSSAQANISQRLRVAYADGPVDVEAMWVAPDTSVWFATKRPLADAQGRPRRARLYRVGADAWTRDQVATALLVDSLPIVPRTSVSRDWISDAALSAVRTDGRRQLAVLTYGSVYVFDADPNTGRPGAQHARCAVPIQEKQAEGITWLPDGRLLLVNEGRGARLYTGRCP
jgi:hypothetical protein